MNYRFALEMATYYINKHVLIQLEILVNINVFKIFIKNTEKLASDDLSAGINTEYDK
jgi:hypothetical protein